MRTLALLFFFLFSVSAFAEEPDIEEYLKMVANGKLKEVKSQLPDLLVEYPDNPGVKLLLAVVIEDAYKALDIYKQIASDYPESKWADDAYWRIVQFYAVQGNTDKAKSELRYFRVKYPESPYIIPASEVVRISEGVSRNTNKVVKTKHSEAIGRDNKRVEETEISNEPKKEVAQNTTTGLQDFTSKQDKVSEEKPMEKPEAETIQKEQPTDLAFNDANHKVIRKKVIDEEDENEDNPAKAAMIEQQNKMVGNIVKQEEKSQDLASNDLEKKQEVIAEEKSSEDVTEPKKEVTVTEGNSGFYGLQVAVFEDFRKANAEKSKFLKKRMRTDVVPKEIDGTTVYAVVIGNYSSLESAQAAKIIVKQQCDCDPIVFEK